MKHKFFAYCPESGLELHETLDGALDDASDSILHYLEDSWSEDVTGVCVGEITHIAKMCDQVFPDGNVDEDGFDEMGDWWDPDWGYKCNYKILPVERNPAPHVAQLVEALEWIAGVDCKPGEGATDFAVAMDRGMAIGRILHKAAEALAAYRNQGGES